MKALFIKQGNVELQDLPKPEPRKGELVVKMKACGICGTDIEKVRGVHLTPPVLGHEVSGEVFEVGEEVEGHAVGTRIFVHHHVSCGNCVYCRDGSFTMCELFPKTNLEPCGFSEYFRVSRLSVEKGAVIKLPDNLAYEEATFIEPLGCCVRSISKCNFRPGSRVAIFGAGPMGLLNVKLLRAMGAGKILVFDIIEYRLRMATKFGADRTVNLAAEKNFVHTVKEETKGLGADLVIVATGNSEAIRMGFQAVRKGGRLNIFGAPESGATIPLDISSLFIREISIIPSYSTSEMETNIALELISSGRVVVKDMITHSYNLLEAKEAFRRATDGNDSLKVIVVS